MMLLRLHAVDEEALRARFRGIFLRETQSL